MLFSSQFPLRLSPSILLYRFDFVFKYTLDATSEEEKTRKSYLNTKLELCIDFWAKLLAIIIF